jgi:hypothetical protein
LDGGIEDLLALRYKRGDEARVRAISGLLFSGGLKGSLIQWACITVEAPCPVKSPALNRAFEEHIAVGHIGIKVEVYLPFND